MQESIPVDRSLPAGERFVRMLTLIWTEALREENVWRLILGESLRSDEVARRVAGDLAALLQEAIDRWLADLLPELGDRRPAVAEVVAGQSLGILLEFLLLPPRRRLATAETRARALAAVVLPGIDH
jgi:hypothetical protein